MGRCNRCNRYSCSCGSNSCNECSCLVSQKGNCVFYQGTNLTCIDVTKGDDYDSILVGLNEIICDLITPSGVSTVVNSCNSNIVVTNPSTGVYTVCLDQDIPDQITENTNDILAIQACLADTVKDLVSDSITISEESSTDCGRTLRLEVITPSGVPTYDGIVANEGSGNSSSGTGVQILYTFNRNYATLNDIDNGDEIRFVFEGAVNSTTMAPGSITFELFDANTATIVYSFTESSLAKSLAPYSWEIIGTLRRISPTSSYVSAHLGLHPQSNGDYGSFYTPMRGVIKKSIIGLDYSNLSLRIKVNILDASATISVGTEMIEVRKKI